MRNCHVHQRLHAVGHGTFVTGIATDNIRENFSWVYDCGSKRSQPLKDALQRIEGWDRWPDPISMVVLSHFDDDHVNGLEELIKKRRVGCLVLPYSDWQQRLRETAMGGVKGLSPSTAQMQLDPVGWLESRDLIRRIDRLLLIRGGRTDPEATPPDPFILPTGPQNEFNEGQRSGNERYEHLETDLRITGRTATATMKIHALSHHQPVHVSSLPMEYMFYNAELSCSDLGIIQNVDGVLVAKKSKLPLSQVRKEVEETIDGLGLVYPFSSLPKHWRATLKACYQKHFGSTGKAKNNISLCLNVLPRNVIGTVKPCSIFSNDEIPDIPLMNCKEFIEFGFSRPAVLYTGDLKMDQQVISEMGSHFSMSRWNLIGLTQVPHHGSAHSWANGNAALLAPSAFVHCAPRSGAHPHPDVIKDLNGQRVFVADYKNSVTLNYHFSN